ncbi:hypothetical protein FACHB389_32140 [Nostoc calcicola FACHB-389]|nr:hypothetical protein FACHB389_32140 [Nostoc calcicola FACHB-389]
MIRLPSKFSLRFFIHFGKRGRWGGEGDEGEEAAGEQGEGGKELIFHSPPCPQQELPLCLLCPMPDTLNSEF